MNTKNGFVLLISIPSAQFQIS